jgi:type VI secretion system VasD/TssJ family lipoprotein
MRAPIVTWVKLAVLSGLLLGSAMLCSGCCSANLMLRKCPAQIDLRLTAAEQLNSCTDQGSYQVMVRVYSLASTGPFHAAEFEDLWYGESDLDGAVLEVLKVTMDPGETQSHRWQRPAGVRALGVVANFCRLDAGCWKQVIELEEGTQRLDLALSGTCLTLGWRP